MPATTRSTINTVTRVKIATPIMPVTIPPNQRQGGLWMLLRRCDLRRRAVRGHRAKGRLIRVGLIERAFIAGWLSIAVAKITVRRRPLRREASFWSGVPGVGAWVAVGLTGHGVRVGRGPSVRVGRGVRGPVTGVLSGRFATCRLIGRRRCRTGVRIRVAPVCGF
ncbi:MAG: hypothetical protein K0R13_210 [Propionibacteriaceae bacterium]|nr:hypothetical protein [Propionibacteriaceae bacterium]